MRCIRCTAEISSSAQFCPQCGQNCQPAKVVVTGRLDFSGTAMQLLGWTLLSAFSFLVVLPSAWVQAAMARWICRNLRFSDGTTAIFRGTGGQVLGWWTLYILVVVGFQVANIMASKLGIGAVVLVLLAYLVINAGIGLKLIGWFISNVELSSGPRLSFAGTYGGLLGWTALSILSIYTIIGFAWVGTAMYRWFARNTRGIGVEFQFHGKGHQLLWRLLVFLLACVLIIPIPWMSLWVMRWMIRSISMSRIASAPMVAPA